MALFPLSLPLIASDFVLKTRQHSPTAQAVLRAIREAHRAGQGAFLRLPGRLRVPGLAKKDAKFRAFLQRAADGGVEARWLRWQTGASTLPPIHYSEAPSARAVSDERLATLAV